MTLLGREDILVVQDVVFEDVAVPGWGGVVRVKALSGMERDRFEEYVTQTKKKGLNFANIRARLAQMAIVDEDGKPVFRHSDIEALGKKSAAALDRVFDAAMRLAGMGTQDIEDLTENFTIDRSDDSTSISP